MATFINNDFAGPGPAFNVMGNRCKKFEFGRSASGDVWLQGNTIDGEFIFNGRLFSRAGHAGVVIDNFPKAAAPDGWTQRRRLDVEGYELVDANGDAIFSYRIVDGDCIVDVDLYTKDGSAAAHGGQGGLVVHITPMSFG